MRRRTFAISGTLLARRLLAQQNNKTRVYQKSEVTVLVRRAIGEHLNDKSRQVADGSRFVEDLGMDSLDVVELMVKLEETFGINCSDDELAPNKVKDAIETVRTHLKDADRLR
jgi:acyl carrier protein